MLKFCSENDSTSTNHPRLLTQGASWISDVLVFFNRAHLDLSSRYKYRPFNSSFTVYIKDPLSK